MASYYNEEAAPSEKVASDMCARSFIGVFVMRMKKCCILAYLNARSDQTARLLNTHKEGAFSDFAAQMVYI